MDLLFGLLLVGDLMMGVNLGGDVGFSGGLEVNDNLLGGGVEIGFFVGNLGEDFVGGGFFGE